MKVRARETMSLRLKMAGSVRLTFCFEFIGSYFVLCILLILSRVNRRRALLSLFLINYNRHKNVILRGGGQAGVVIINHPSHLHHKRWMWAEFSVDLNLTSKVFRRVLRFPPSPKPTHAVLASCSLTTFRIIKYEMKSFWDITFPASNKQSFYYYV